VGLLSASRGTFLVALRVALYVIGLALGRAARARGSRPRAAAASLVAILAAGWLTSFVSDRAAAATARLTKLFDEDRSLANRTSGRSDLARIGWEIFEDHPLGIGTGEFIRYAAVFGARENLPVFTTSTRSCRRTRRG
jgi:O-antigen ligase